MNQHVAELHVHLIFGVDHRLDPASDQPGDRGVQLVADETAEAEAEREQQTRVQNQLMPRGGFA